jgi:hypothetical protein
LGFWDHSKILGFFQRFFWIFDEVYEDFKSNLPLGKMVLKLFTTFMTEVLAPDIYIELAGFTSQTKSKRLQRACEQVLLKASKGPYRIADRTRFGSATRIFNFQ